MKGPGGQADRVRIAMNGKPGRLRSHFDGFDWAPDFGGFILAGVGGR